MTMVGTVGGARRRWIRQCRYREGRIPSRRGDNNNGRQQQSSLAADLAVPPSGGVDPVPPALVEGCEDIGGVLGI
uniref:Uncharacterized protein n=1 Tax=Oryza meridionalis TaxID=40149 RepID=A0A0E0E066_9ORYZ